MLKRPLVNNQIRAREVRIIDEKGKQVGIMPIEQARQLALESKLDLVQVTEKVQPPVCRLMNYGKYLYSLKKKERKIKKRAAGQVKRIRLGFNISLHDLEIRAKQAENFLKKNYKVRVELPLRGREKALEEQAKGKINQFIELLSKLTQVKIEREIKKEPRGFTMIITKQ